jgi:hypothetical protein
VRKADNLATFMCRLSKNLGASWNHKGLSRPVMGLIYLNPKDQITMQEVVDAVSKEK